MARASTRRGLPSVCPRALAAARAAFVRCEIRARSFSAKAANKCNMKGSASAPSFDADKGHLLDHERGHESNVTGQPIELRDDHGAGLAMTAGLGQRGGELRATIERVRALPRLDLDMLGDDFEALGLGEPGDGGALRLNAEP
jgi:hypothetical protein